MARQILFFAKTVGIGGGAGATAAVRSGALGKGWVGGQAGQQAGASGVMGFLDICCAAALGGSSSGLHARSFLEGPHITGSVGVMRRVCAWPNKAFPGEVCHAEL